MKRNTAPLLILLALLIAVPALAYRDPAQPVTIIGNDVVLESIDSLKTRLEADSARLNDSSAVKLDLHGQADSAAQADLADSATAAAHSHTTDSIADTSKSARFDLLRSLAFEFGDSVTMVQPSLSKGARTRYYFTICKDADTLGQSGDSVVTIKRTYWYRNDDVLGTYERKSERILTVTAEGLYFKSTVPFYGDDGYGLVFKGMTQTDSGLAISVEGANGLPYVIRNGAGAGQAVMIEDYTTGDSITIGCYTDMSTSPVTGLPVGSLVWEKTTSRWFIKYADADDFTGWGMLPFYRTASGGTQRALGIDTLPVDSAYITNVAGTCDTAKNVQGLDTTALQARSLPVHGKADSAATAETATDVVAGIIAWSTARQATYIAGLTATCVPTLAADSTALAELASDGGVLGAWCKSDSLVVFAIGVSSPAGNINYIIKKQ